MANFGRICKAKERTYFSNLADSLTVFKEIKTPAIFHGQQYESIALAKYESENGRGTRQCGMFDSKSHPFIGATTDAIIDDEAVLEIKLSFCCEKSDDKYKISTILKSGGQTLIS